MAKDENAPLLKEALIKDYGADAAEDLVDFAQDVAWALGKFPKCSVEEIALIEANYPYERETGYPFEETLTAELEKKIPKLASEIGLEKEQSITGSEEGRPAKLTINKKTTEACRRLLGTAPIKYEKNNWVFNDSPGTVVPLVKGATAGSTPIDTMEFIKVLKASRKSLSSGKEQYSKAAAFAEFSSAVNNANEYKGQRAVNNKAAAEKRAAEKAAGNTKGNGRTAKPAAKPAPAKKTTAKKTTAKASTKKEEAAEAPAKAGSGGRPKK